MTGLDTAQAALIGGNTAFAWDLYHCLRVGKGNLAFSPYSISAALAMTYAGACGPTAQEMAQVLHFGPDQEPLHAAFAALARRLAETGEGFQLQIANALWGHRRFAFLSDFLEMLKRHYGAGLESVNFSQPEEARQTINAWVRDRTAGRIEELIPPGILTTLTRLVLTNAVYFKAAWDEPFDPAATAGGPFYRLAGDPVTAPMMHRTGILRYATGEGYQALELPYHGHRLSLALLLPDAGRFAAFERRLGAEQLGAIGQALAPRRIELALPRFRVQFATNLAATLAGMGMPLAFSDDADFAGMTGAPDLIIAAVLHQAFVAVDEAGTEAAAATAVVMRLRGALMEDPPLPVTVDRPFLFLIRDRQTGTIVFLGRVLDPTA